MVALSSSTFSENPHSRARSIASICTDPSRCKSLQRIEMRLSIYESRIGLDSFSRDPIGYVDGANLYQFVRNSSLTFVDPMGWVLTMVPSDIRNHPFIEHQLPGIRVGETSCDFTVTCNCSRDWKRSGGCLFATYWPDGYDCKFEYLLKTQIIMDTAKIGGRGPSWEGWYGHELTHVMNCRRKARQLSQRINAHFDSVDDCNSAAVSIEMDFMAWKRDEVAHANPESPLPNEQYPIDYELDEYELPHVPFPIPIPQKRL